MMRLLMKVKVTSAASTNAGHKKEENKTRKKDDGPFAELGQHVDEYWGNEVKANASNHNTYGNDKNP